MLMTRFMVMSFFQATLTVYRENGADGTVKVGICFDDDDDNHHYQSETFFL